MTKESIEFTMSLDNIKKIPFDKYENNFTFVVNGVKYKTNRLIADLFSPIIRSYHYQDPTIDEFSICTDKTKQTKDSDDYFTEFLNLSKFEKIELDESRRKAFIQYFIQLGNIEESFKLQQELFEELSPKNVVDRLKIIIESIEKVSNKFESTEMISKINTEGSISQMINYAASHFEEIDKEKMKELNEEILEEIIKNDGMKIEDEDTLLDFIIDLYETNRQYSKLFEYAEFLNASDEKIEKFIEKFQFDDLSVGIWRMICKRLVTSKNKSKSEKQSKLESECIDKPYKKGSEFNGIMKFLTDETGGNIHDNGTIEITSNSIYDNDISHHPKNLVEYQNTNCYESANSENSAVCFDFKDKEIQLTSYSIKSYFRSQGTRHLKNWVIEVSKDAKLWEKVDEHSNDSSLNNSNRVATFHTKQSDSFYRFIRLRQTGKNWINDFDTFICLLEFYGKLKPIKSSKHE